jgi:hypothetical protein
MVTQPPIETPPENSFPEAPLPEPFACQFCDAPAAAGCPRCGALYCTQHGDTACDACSDPASGLPSPYTARIAGAGLVIAAAAALWMIIAPPRLPGERAPLETAAPPPAATVAPGRGGGQGQIQGTGPAAGSPGSSQGAGTPVPGASPTSPAEKYTIRSGDTLGQVAAQFGTTVDALRAANPGLDERALQIGQEILIPPR